MNSKKIILDFLNALEEKSFISDRENIIKVNIKDKTYTLFEYVNYSELKNIFDTLKKEKVIEVIKEPYLYFFKGHICFYENISGDPLEPLNYYLKIGLCFKQYKSRLLKEISSEMDNKISYEIIFDEDYDYVYLFDNFKQVKYKIIKYQYYSDHKKIMEYLFDNKDRMVEIKELEKVINFDIKKSTSEIIRDLGFTGIIATLFFKISKTKIQFKNQVKNKITIGLEQEIQNILNTKYKNLKKM